MKKIPISEATLAQLLRFAKENLQLEDIKPGLTQSKVISLIKAAWAEDFIVVQESADADDAQQIAAAATAKPAAANPMPRRLAGVNVLRFAVLDPRVRMTVFEGAGEDGRDPVFTAVNGVAFLIPRGKEVEVPYRYFLAMAGSQQDSFLWDGKDKTDKRTVQSYPHTVHRPVPDAEVQAWIKMVEDYEVEMDQKRRRAEKENAAA